DDDGLHHVALLHCAVRRRLLDRADDDVPHVRVATLRAAHDADAEDLARTGVVGHAESGFLLDHRARSTISTRRQRFCAESGRHSMTRTVSPTFASLRSSWTCSLSER